MRCFLFKILIGASVNDVHWRGEGGRVGAGIEESKMTVSLQEYVTEYDSRGKTRIGVTVK